MIATKNAATTRQKKITHKKTTTNSIRVGGGLNGRAFTIAAFAAIV